MVNASWKSAHSLSQPCQTVINDLRQAYQGLAALRGLPVHGSDDKELGQVVEVNKALTGKFSPSNLSSVGGLDSAPKLSPLPLTNSSNWPIGLNYASGVKMFSRCRMRLKNRLGSEPSRRPASFGRHHRGNQFARSLSLRSSCRMPHSTVRRCGAGYSAMSPNPANTDAPPPTPQYT